jgi:hypothetical protein
VCDFELAFFSPFRTGFVGPVGMAVKAQRNWCFGLVRKKTEAACVYLGFTT